MAHHNSYIASLRFILIYQSVNTDFHLIEIYSAAYKKTRAAVNNTKEKTSLLP